MIFNKAGLSRGPDSAAEPSWFCTPATLADMRHAQPYMIDSRPEAAGQFANPKKSRRRVCVLSELRLELNFLIVSLRLAHVVKRFDRVLSRDFVLSQPSSQSADFWGALRGLSLEENRFT
jgi:hypothetical protein